MLSVARLRIISLALCLVSCVSPTPLAPTPAFFERIPASANVKSCESLLPKFLAKSESEEQVFRNPEALSKYLTLKLGEFTQSSADRKIFRFFEDKNKSLEDLLSWESGAIEKQHVGQKIRFKRLEMNFSTFESSVIYTVGRSRQEQTYIYSGSAAAKFEKSIARQLNNLEETARDELQSVANLSQKEIKNILGDARKHLRLFAKDLSTDSIFYHVTKNKESLKEILTDEMRPGSGFVGSGVYVVALDQKRALQKWMKSAKWSSSPQTLTVEVRISPTAIVIDTTSPEGMRAVEAFAELHPELSKSSERARLLEAYMDYLKGDIIRYRWGEMDAFVVKNVEVIESVTHHKPR
jgi:hypothetical protein